MTATKGPIPWANRISRILDTVKSENRYPVDVKNLALELSADLFGSDPIIRIHGESFPDIEGALVRVPNNGWAILYNSGITSPGRINFTLAHEFGHYLLHREVITDELRCNLRSMLTSGSPSKNLEQEANEFSAYLLMPLHDYRKQIGAKDRPSIEELSMCSTRYGTSLVAAILRWIEYTSTQAILIISKDGYIDWARSSESAKKARRYFKPSAGPIEVPAASPTHRLAVEDRSVRVEHPAGVWFDTRSTEHALRSDQYDFSLSLVFLHE